MRISSCMPAFLCNHDCDWGIEGRNRRPGIITYIKDRKNLIKLQPIFSTCKSWIALSLLLFLSLLWFWHLLFPFKLQRWLQVMTSKVKAVAITVVLKISFNQQLPCFLGSIWRRLLCFPVKHSNKPQSILKSYQWLAFIDNECNIMILGGHLF